LAAPGRKGGGGGCGLWAGEASKDKGKGRRGLGFLSEEEVGFNGPPFSWEQAEIISEKAPI